MQTDGNIKYNYENLASDEAQVSIRDVRFAPDLDQRKIINVILYGLTRFKNQGIELKDVKKSLDIY